MSKYYQNIQNIYKLKYNKKHYYNNLIRYVYLYKYLICINIYELDFKVLKEIKQYSNSLDLKQYIFSSSIIKKVFLNKIFFALNGHSLIYATNNKDLFFSILKKINLYYFICYEKSLFYYNEQNELNFVSLYNQHDKSYSEIFIIFSNFYLINIFILIHCLIFKIIIII